MEKPLLLSTSLIVLLTLIAIFAASWVMFWLLAERSTGQSRWLGMLEWGKERGFRSRTLTPDRLPPLLQSILDQRLSVRTCLMAKRLTLIEFETIPTGVIEQQGAGPRTWHVLVRRLNTSWPPTGLRPVAAATSVLDLYSLTSFPLLGSAARFVMFGTESKAAAALSRSSARGLLPADVGLLLQGKDLVLDFSGRPFDTIEFERMIAVADQIVTHLPLPNSAE